MEKYELEKMLSESEGEIIEDRRAIHACPEVGFELTKTVSYIKKRLDEFGVEYKELGGGIVAWLGRKNGGTVLLRADMDALNMREETELSFASKNENMHACGHDMHTAMLLGAVRVLSKMRNKIKGRIVFTFQPAEETLEGAKRMIDAGLLDLYKPCAAIMIHTLVGIPLSRDTAVIGSGGISAPSADFFRINIEGNSSHGATPHLSADALSCGTEIVSSLAKVIGREVSVSAGAVMSFGMFKSGSCANVMADKAVIEGTFRTLDDRVREYLRTRVSDIVDLTSKIYRANGRVEYFSGCPTLKNDKELSARVHTYVSELIGNNCYYSAELGGTAGGSEDFSYISQSIPSVMIGLMAGSSDDGFNVPLHNPKVVFDESALKLGAMLYAWCAVRYLNEK